LKRRQLEQIGPLWSPILPSKQFVDVQMLRLNYVEDGLCA